MKTFNYHSAKDVKEASKLASSNSAFLAGGMTTIPSIKLGLATYKDIINIKNIKSLSGIKVSGKTVKSGATTKHVEVANSKDVKKAINARAWLLESGDYLREWKKAKPQLKDSDCEAEGKKGYQLEHQLCEDVWGVIFSYLAPDHTPAINYL